MSWLRRLRSLLPQAIGGPFAPLYEWLAAPGLARLHRQVASDIASAPPGGRVLDVGTGPAHLLVEVARRSPHLELVGLDLSHRMLRIARTVLARGMRADEAAPTRRVHGPVWLVRADVRSLPFGDGVFGLVVSTVSMHHWRDRASGIRECYRVTAPGGQCWLYDLRADAPARAHAALAAGGRLRRLVLGWVFKAHGVRPKELAAERVARWVGGAAAVRAEVGAAYVKVSIQKPPAPPVRPSGCGHAGHSLPGPPRACSADAPR